MAQTLYKQTEFGKWSTEDFISFIDSDPAGSEWFDRAARQFVYDIKARHGAREFGIEAAREVIAAAIVKGFYTPSFMTTKGE